MSEKSRGRFTIFHELSHYVYHSTTNDTYKISKESKNRILSLATCIDSSKVKSVLKTDSIYTGEDFADAVAAIFTKDETGVAFACKPIAYLKSQGLEDSAFTLDNSSQEDPHSSLFYRILRVEQIRKKQIPPTCQEAVTQQPKSKRIDDLFKTCKFKKGSQ